MLPWTSDLRNCTGIHHGKPRPPTSPHSPFLARGRRGFPARARRRQDKGMPSWPSGLPRTTTAPSRRDHWRVRHLALSPPPRISLQLQRASSRRPHTPRTPWRRKRPRGTPPLPSRPRHGPLTPSLGARTPGSNTLPPWPTVASPDTCQQLALPLAARDHKATPPRARSVFAASLRALDSVVTRTHHGPTSPPWSTLLRRGAARRGDGDGAGADTSFRITHGVSGGGKRISGSAPAV